MVAKFPIPRAATPLVEASGYPTREWYSYLQNLQTDSGGPSNADLANDVTIIADKLGSPDGTPENIPPLAGSGIVLGVQSIASYGALPGVVQLSLQGDTDTPGNTYYYGTGPAGDKGYWAVSSAFLGTSGDITLTTGPDGVTTIDLANVADSGTGTLLAITRDTKGRVSGTRDATITGTANRVTVTNGNASAGVPTIDIAATYIGQASITTLGTITTGTWHGTPVEAAYGGTGQSNYAVGDLLYASAATTLSKRAIGATGQYLGITGGVPAWRTIVASEINVDRIAGSTYSTLQQFINTMHSPGTIDGPTPILADQGGGTIRVFAGKGMIRIADDDVSSLPFFDWAQTDFTQAADGFTRFYGVTYNGGVPLVVQRTTYNWDFDTELPLGSAVRFASGATVVTPNPFKTGDPITNIIQRFDAQSPAIRDASVGGLILGNIATRQATLSTGKVWSRLSDYTAAAKASATAPLWSAYFNGTNLTVTTGLTQWDNSQYNNGTVLAAVPSNKYSAIYFFISIDGTTWGFAYGQATYSTPAAASADTVPSYLNQNFFDQALLLGRIIFQQGNDTPISIDSAFTRTFGFGAVTDHNNLSGIQDAPSPAANEHYHLSSAQATQASVIASAQSANSHFAGPTSGAAALPSFRPLVIADLPSINYAFRNRLINGKFGIWQRGTALSAAVQNSYLADRWKDVSAGTTIAPSRQAFTLGQTDVPGEPAFFHRSVVASVAGSGNLAVLQQNIESVRTGAGQAGVLTFYAKADAAKNIAVEFVQNFGSGGSPSASVISIGVTTCALTTAWVKFTVPVSVPSISGKTLGSNNNDYLQITFWMDAGSALNARTNSLGQQSGTFDIAKVQFEIGTGATAFDDRPDEVELALCQRYYEKSYDLDTVPGTAGVTNSASAAYADQLNSSTHLAGLNVFYRVTKRGVPSINTYSTITGAAGKTRDLVNSSDVNSGVSNIGQNVFFNGAAASAAAISYNFQWHWTADAEL